MCPWDEARAQLQVWVKVAMGMVLTQVLDVATPSPGHVVLLDGLVECSLAQQQEAQANPHTQ